MIELLKNKSFKRVTLLVICILCILGLGVYLQMKNDKQKEDDVSRFAAMQEFGDSSVSTIPPEEGSNLEESPEFELENRMEVIETFDNSDDALCVINGVQENFNYLDIITEGLKQFDISTYFEANKDTIFKIYGINDEELFEKFITPIIDVGELKKFEFDLDSIEKLSNQYKVDVIIKGEKGTCTVPLLATIKIDTLTSSIFVLEGDAIGE